MISNQELAEALGIDTNTDYVKQQVSELRDSIGLCAATGQVKEYVYDILILDKINDLTHKILDTYDRVNIMWDKFIEKNNLD